MAIRHKRKNSAGYTWQTGDLVEGQIGLNIADGTLHFDKADGTTVTIASDTGITDIVEDTTPQLGGNLDVNGNSIVSASNGDIAITPNGTGAVIIDGNEFPQTQGTAGEVLTADGSGLVEWKLNQTLTAQVYNADSVTINKGDPVYVFSSSGTNISVKLALNTGDSTSAQTLGLANENITAGSTGVVVCQGLVKNVDTSSYTAGQALYLGSTSGTKTTSKPYAPNHLVYLGFVETVNSTSGRIYVRIQNGYELDEIHDVNINHNVSIANKDYLVYNSSNSLWENRQLDIVNDTTPQLGGNLDVQANTITTSTTDGNISLIPNGIGLVYLGADKVLIGDSNTTATITTNGTGNLVLNTNNGTNSGTIQINQGAAGNILITPDTTGDVYLQADTIFVGDSGVNANISSQGVADLILQTNGGTNTGAITISGANSPITLEPNGTGDVNLNADTVRVGDSGAAATITTNGAGNLTLSTNSGTNAGTIVLTQGTNGNITITPNGTGSTVLAGPSVSVITPPSANVAAMQFRSTVTSSATDTYPSIMVSKHRSDIAFSSMTDEPAVMNFTVRDNTNANRQFGRWIGRFAGTSTNPTFQLRGSPDGFTTNLQYVTFGSSTTVWGNTNTAYTLTTNGTGDLTLNTNSGSNSGSIVITQGANANVSVTPNGTGKTVITNAVAYEYVYTGGSTTGTITPNAALGTIQSITLTGNITWSAFTTPLAGQTITMIIKQPASGGPYTLTSTMLFAGASKTLSTAANAVDILSVTYDGTNYWASLSKGYA